ncbi:MAG: hypothetical protein B7X06_03635 [Verrucomicrobia bacterium 21-51-4]|nr:MAG: hypothetical protein B7X06_03635 [Verrucomicrobia bacterium 21-51-4]
MRKSFESLLDGELTAARSGTAGKASKKKGPVAQPDFNFKPAKTAISADTVKALTQKLTEVPAGFKVNSKIERQLHSKAEAAKTGQNIDWALGEALAYGSLVQDGNPVRISGQDCERGTFSHRHAVLYDAETRARYAPLEHIAPKQAHFAVYNSSLSECAVLGFEYGYSLEIPQGLTIWEAQFGDFGNGAQVIIDQFIVSGESKWQAASGLTLLLPHGQEGQGPEHSSARLERFLQSCAEDNIQVANVTTPAQIFHLLRRQVKRDFIKPLVIMSPKSLLRHKACVSRIEDFTQGTFQEILDDTTAPTQVKRVIMCSGKVYYDLEAYRQEHKITNVAILRVEQLYPLHGARLCELIKQYSGFEKLVWCQEEPRNMGAWSFISPLIEELCGQKAHYAGRKAAASPAVGYAARHKLDQAAVVAQAFTL